MDIEARHLRLALPSDAADLQTYFRHLSKEARYNRFLGHVGDVPLGTVMRNIGWTGDNLFSLLAIGGNAEAPRIVGETVCAIETVAGDMIAEIAVSVADASQCHGIGHALLAASEVIARQRGACELTGTCWSSNQPIRKLCTSLGYAVERTSGDWHCYTLRKPLAAALPAAAISFRRMAAAADAT